MRHALTLLALVLSASISAIGQANNEKAPVQPRMISVGDRRIAVYCDSKGWSLFYRNPHSGWWPSRSGLVEGPDCASELWAARLQL